MQNATTGLSLASLRFQLLTLQASKLAQHYPPISFYILNYLLCTLLGVRHGSSELKQILIK